MGCFLLVMLGWVFSVCLHEYGHAIVAYHGGYHQSPADPHLGWFQFHPALVAVHTREWLTDNATAIFFVFIMVMMNPNMSRVLFTAVFWIFDLTGVSRELAESGYDAFRFWA